jgi:hypothetical protein
MPHAHRPGARRTHDWIEAIGFRWRTTFIIVGFAALIWLVPWFLATPSQMRDSGATADAPASDEELPNLLRNRDLWGVLLVFSVSIILVFHYYLVAELLRECEGVTILEAWHPRFDPLFSIWDLSAARRMDRGQVDTPWLGTGPRRKIIISFAFLSGS